MGLPADWHFGDTGDAKLLDRLLSQLLRQAEGPLLVSAHKSKSRS
jgi:hypothetical protein